MVLAKLFLDRVRDESKEIGREEGVEIGRAEGVEIGRSEMRALWREWNDRRKQAERTGLPFTEPEP